MVREYCDHCNAEITNHNTSAEIGEFIFCDYECAGQYFLEKAKRVKEERKRMMMGFQK